MANKGRKKSLTKFDSWYSRGSTCIVAFVAVFSAGFETGGYITEVRIKYERIEAYDMKNNRSEISHDTISTNNNVEIYATKAEFEEFKKNYIQNNKLNGSK